MKTINLELSKRLAPYLESTKTKYVLTTIWRATWDSELRNAHLETIEKTEDHTPMELDTKLMNLEEAIEFLPNGIEIKKDEWIYFVFYKDEMYMNTTNKLILAIESMLEYLLDNNLLWQK